MQTDTCSTVPPFPLIPHVVLARFCILAGQGLQRGVFSFHSQAADALPPDVVGGQTGSFVDLQVLAKSVVSSGNLTGHMKNLSVGSLDNLEVMLKQVWTDKRTKKA